MGITINILVLLLSRRSDFSVAERSRSLGMERILFEKQQPHLLFSNRRFDSTTSFTFSLIIESQKSTSTSPNPEPRTQNSEP